MTPSTTAAARTSVLALLAALVAIAAMPATAGAANLQSRTLFLSERFGSTGSGSDGSRVFDESPSNGRYWERYWGDDVQPDSMWAVQGEQQGFMLIVKGGINDTAYVEVDASGDAALQAEIDAGRIAVEIFRVRTTDLGNTPRSSGYPGDFRRWSDALLPQRLPAGGPPYADTDGLLPIEANRWGGWAIMFKVARTANAGRYSGTLTVRDDSGAAHSISGGGTRSFGLRVFQLKRANGGNSYIPQPGDNDAMKTVMGLAPGKWEFADADLREAPADLAAQTEGIVDFMGEYHVAPEEFPNAEPDTYGRYDSCTGYTDTLRNAGATARHALLGDMLDNGRWWADNYMNRWPALVLPHATPGCDDRYGGNDDYEMVHDNGTPGYKQDDVIRGSSRYFLARAASDWKQFGLWNTGPGVKRYVANPFDEPGDATAVERERMNDDVPRANTYLHQTAGVKVMLTSWPRDSRSFRKCRYVRVWSSSLRRYVFRQRCVTVRRDNTSNLHMWNGGSNDPDVWVVPQSRLYGRESNDTLMQYGWDRRREYHDRLAYIQERLGREIWTYNFHTATVQLPQFVVDAPGTDPLLMYWQLAREGHSGAYFSNSILGFSSQTKYCSADGRNHLARTRPYGGSVTEGGANSFQDWYGQPALYFCHGSFGAAAGWGTFFYPSWSEQFGLDAPGDKAGAPTPTLRMVGIREGSEDANLIERYRQRFGQSRLDQRMKLIFGRNYVALNPRLGNVVWPGHVNTTLAQRMEYQRRIMIAQLSR